MDGKTQGGLKLHTTMQPPETAPATEEPHVRWRLRQRKDRHGAPRVRQRVSKRAPGERLLRNTAIACALLLTVMALGNIDSPATNRVTNAIRGALSMDMSLDESLGKLSFVQNLVPESALVFLNIGGRRSSAGIPVQGETVHAFSEAQPWTEYKTTDAAQVRAIADGTVSAVSQSGEDDWTLLVDHADGSCAVFAYLQSTSVKIGDTIARGDALGAAGNGENARLYLEVRAADAPIDPAKLISEGKR